MPLRGWSNGEPTSSPVQARLPALAPQSGSRRVRRLLARPRPVPGGHLGSGAAPRSRRAGPGAALRPLARAPRYPARAAPTAGPAARTSRPGPAWPRSAPPGGGGTAARRAARRPPAGPPAGWPGGADPVDLRPVHPDHVAAGTRCPGRTRPGSARPSAASHRARPARPGPPPAHRRPRRLPWPLARTSVAQPDAASRSAVSATASGSASTSRRPSRTSANSWLIVSPASRSRPAASCGDQPPAAARRGLRRGRGQVGRGLRGDPVRPGRAPRR